MFVPNCKDGNEDNLTYTDLSDLTNDRTNVTEMHKMVKSNKKFFEIYTKTLNNKNKRRIGSIPSLDIAMHHITDNSITDPFRPLKIFALSAMITKI